MRTPFINKSIFVLYALASLAVGAATLISPQLRSIAYAPLREVLLPPPEPVVLEMLYSTENVPGWKISLSFSMHQIPVRLAGQSSFILNPWGLARWFSQYLRALVLILSVQPVHSRFQFLRICPEPNLAFQL